MFEVLVGAIVAAAAGTLFSYILNKKSKSRSEHLNEEYKDKVKESAAEVGSSIGKFNMDSEKEAKLLNNVINLLGTTGPTYSQSEIDNKIKKVDKKAKELREKIEEMNKQELTRGKLSERYDFIDNLLMSKGIESINDRLVEIERKILTKWDVAVIVFTILGAFGILLGIIMNLFELFKMLI